MPNCLDRCSLEDKLRQNLDVARTRYEHADQQFHRLNDIAQSLGLNTADGSFALRKASAEYRVSLQNYRRCLKRFSDLVLHAQEPK